MDISLFDYKLPEELIAQQPSRRRDQSRLMVIDRSVSDSSSIEGVHPFKDVISYLRKGDALVVNNTKVFKARLLGRRQSGGQVEVFLVRRSLGSSAHSGTGKAKRRPCHWYALAQPSRKLKEGEEVLFGRRSVRLVEYYGEGSWLVDFGSESNWQRIVAADGHVPLPQYIKRDDSNNDIRRYQTVYAESNKVGAVAAPTAGFHFTKPVLDAIRAKGVKFVELTLHVGPGTFKPVTADKVEDHTVDPEFAVLSAKAARTLNTVRARGGRITAVGTTSVRTLESAPIVDGEIQPFSGMVDLYIKPGFKFKLVDSLLTNFHLPKSSLLILVSAFAGRERILDAYHRAIIERMRFYSYGDCMLIL